MTEERSLYNPKSCRILAVSDLTPQEKLFRLQLNDGSPLNHLPGQFVQISIPGLTEAPISIASSPTCADYFEIGVRKTGLLTNALHRLQPGAQIGIRGPFGRPFQLEALPGKQLLLLAGGCGLAPLRSLIQYCQNQPSVYASVHILYGARSPQDLLFKDELLHWKIIDHFSCQYTVDQNPSGSCYDGQTGLLTQLLDGVQIDTENCCAVLVGPPPMYRPIIRQLRSKGLVGPQQIMLSLERQMRCGVGKCGHCTIEHLSCCCDGPIFWLEEIEQLRGAL